MLTQDFKPSIPAKFNLLSTDVKPTDCPNGSRINEIDTGKVYLFDEENKVWYEKSNSGGGGGGGGSVTVDTTVNGASANPVQNKAIYDFVNSSVATKQDTISDLSEIRSGATAGATAVQPTDMSTALEVKQDKLTFDSTPTESSTDPVTSGGVWTDQQRQETEIGAVANAGAKNLLKVTSSTQTINGVTFTVNNDQTITVNGTNTGKSTALFVINDIPLQLGIAYTLSGCPSGGSTATYYIGSLDTTDWQEFTTDTGNGGTATLNEPKTIRFRIGIRSGVTVDNLVFKPMLRPASITDDTLVPYAKTNRELTVAEDEDRAALVKQVDGGAKNLFNINATPITYHTTYTLTDEKLTVSASGTWAHYSVSIDLPAGDYILSMMISGYSKASEAPDTSMRLRMSATTSGGTSVVLQTIAGNGYVSVPFTWTGGQIYLQFYPNYNATSYENSFSAEDVIICTAEDYAISPAFVPYAPTNRELYETGQLCYDFIFGVGTALQNNDNLDDYKAPGKVFAANGAIAATIANTPWTQSGFTAITIPNLTLTSCMQFVLPNTMGGKWYRRRYMQETWSPWFEYDGTQVVTT